MDLAEPVAQIALLKIPACSIKRSREAVIAKSLLKPEQVV
jgi:hypothetical protein